MIFDPCTPIVLELPAESTADERGSVEDAAAMWNQVAFADLRLDPAAEGRRLPLELVDTALFHGRFDDDEGDIELARRVNRRHPRAVVLAHELGHAFGLYHVDESDRTSVMNEGNTEIPPTPEDGAALQQLWGDCAAPAPID